VFIYTVGTTETWDNGQAMAAVAEMAAKGFVAAAVQYDSSAFGTCSQILSKASYIYNSGSSNSAVAKLCARAKADCSKGVVTAGFSQGSIIAINARNYDSRVRAAYGMGAHNYYSGYTMNSCMNAGSYTLNKNNVRIVNGEVDAFPGGTASTVRSSSQSVAGKTCSSTSYECLNSNGSGWIMVRNSAVGDGQADHCYQRATAGCSGSQNSLDNAWRNGSANWGVKANLTWLAGFATK
jgi:predicted esterase